MTHYSALGREIDEIAERIRLQIPEDHYFEPDAFRVQLKKCWEELGCPLPEERQFYRRLDMCGIPTKDFFDRDDLKRMITLSLWLLKYPKRGAGRYRKYCTLTTSGG